MGMVQRAEGASVRSFSRFVRRSHLGFLMACSIAAAFLFVGCSPVPSASQGIKELEKSATSETRQVQQVVAKTIQQQFTGRQLSLQSHAAWQMMHGFLAYRKPFTVANGDQQVVLFDHLMQGGEMEGWELFPGDVLPATGRQGIKARLSPGDYVGQGHIDQWIAIFAQCNIPIDQTVMVRGKSFTLTDWLRQAQWDVPDNYTGEYSWTLIALMHYFPNERTWVAKDGDSWSWEQLVEFELSQDINRSACGGSHRLEALGLALQHHLRTGGKLEGVWLQTHEKILAEIEKARQWQNIDGSLSAQFLERPGATSDLGQGISSTGHIFEFIAMTAPDEMLDDPWVEKCALRLCDVLYATRDVDLECGGLYHAVHGLIVYHQRRWGGDESLWHQAASPSATSPAVISPQASAATNPL